MRSKPPHTWQRMQASWHPMQTCPGSNWSARLMADRLTQLIHAHQHDPADDQQTTEELDQPG